MCTVRVAFCLTVSTCSLHFSLVSRVRLRYLHVVDGFISPYSVWMGALMLMRLRDLVKCVSWNLLGAKTDACVFAHRCAFLSTVLSTSHVRSVVFPYVRIATLLMYPVDMASVCSLHCSIKSAL